MRVRPLAALALLMLAGCLGGRPGAGPAALSPVDDAAVAGCDGPIFGGDRVRAREIDVASDRNDPERVAAAMMVSVPSTRSRPPDDVAMWTAVARSADGGATWAWKDLSGWPGDPAIASSPFAGSAILGDPIVRFLPDGTLLQVGLAIRGGAWIDVFAARFPGDALEPAEVSILSRGGYGEQALNGVPGPYQVFYNDKPEVGVDPRTGAIYVGWMWRTNRPDSGSNSVPVVALSTDGGRTWQGPVELVETPGAGATSGGLHAGAFPFVTEDGRVHVVWWDQKSASLWLVDAASGTLDFGARRLLHETGGSFSSPGGVIAFGAPSVAVGPGPGGAGERAYVVWTQEAEGRGFDVFASWSDDDAATWSPSARVNDDATASDQLLPAVAVAPDGTVGVSFVDRRGDPSNVAYHAYLGVSRDGAAFQNVRMTSVASEPDRIRDPIQPVGDYYGVAWGARGFVAAWEDGREGTAEVPYGTAYRCVVPLR